MFKHLNIKGHKVLFYKNHSKIGMVQALFNVGSMDEDSDNHGTAHFLEHMMFKGTKTRTREAFQKEIARYGNVNAFTDYDKTCYHLDFLISETEKAFDIFFDLIFNQTINETDVEKEKSIILEELKGGEDDPDTYFFDYLIDNFSFGYAPSIIGNEQSIKDVTIDKLLKFKNEKYSDMVIVVVGNIKEDFLRSCLEKILPISNNKNSEKKTVEIEKNWREYRFHHSSEQAYLAIIGQGSSVAHDVNSRFIRGVFHNGLGGGMHSILFEKVREQLGLCYSVSSNYFEHKGLYANLIDCQLDEKNIDQACNKIYEIINDISKNGFDSDLLDIAKINYLTNIAKKYDSSYGIADISNSYFLNFKLPSFKDYEKKVGKITNNDIVEYSKKTFEDGIKLCVMTKE